jgi:hypothetical protein
MNPEEPELGQFEEQLRQLLPAEPSETLTARIFDAFETPQDAAPAVISEQASEIPTPSPGTVVRWLQPFAAAAAVALVAGIVVIIGLNRQPAAAPTAAEEPKARFTPAHAQNTYQGSRLDGLVFTEDRRAMQTVRHLFTDTYTWENPLDGSRVEVSIPVERVRYVPVPTD